MKLSNKVRIDCEGRNLALLTDRLCRNGVDISGFKRGEGRKFVFFVQKKDLAKTFAILDETCYNYSTQGVTELTLTFRELLRRTALPIALIVFSVLAMLSRMLIWRVEIAGNDAVPDKVIVNALNDLGVSRGKRTSAYDEQAVNAALRNIDGIKMVSSRLVGTTVKVEVYESSAVAPPLTSQDSDVLSEFDATVTRIVASSGTALVKPGQNVFAGTPLIGAYRTAAEGEPQVPCKAGGVVYGIVAHTETVVAASETYEEVPAGSKTYTRIGIFGLWIGKRPSTERGSYAATKTEKFSAFLPIKVERTVVTKTTSRKVERSVEELIERAETKVSAEFITAFSPTGGYKVSSAVRDIGGGAYEISVFVEAETVIGSSRIGQ